MHPLIELMRPTEWYKNITVVLGILLALLYNPGILISPLTFSIVLLASICLSSANYVLNAITDVKSDKHNPLKSKRPLPRGSVSMRMAHHFQLCLLIIGFILALYVNIPVFLICGLLVLAAQLYNIPPLRLKDISYMDVISESVNNPLRFLIGWYAFNPGMPPIQLILFFWTSGAALMSHKRLMELQKGPLHRKVLKQYSKTALQAATILYGLVSALLLMLVIL
ncbi:MAG TPA: UbiA family prenyltransferase [Candidatus Nanoarchaeia archaeon]|nr:UbiA family prenyltransferase [Candidatus Nanoarchaeia archaeon]